jgi:hypothetical protein
MPRMDDPEGRDLDDEMYAWHYWRGVSGLYYARRKLSSPPVVLRGKTLEELREQVAAHVKAKGLQRRQDRPGTAMDGSWDGTRPAR